MGDDGRNKRNLRLALILGSVALAFFLGFIARAAFFS